MSQRRVGGDQCFAIANFQPGYLFYLKYILSKKEKSIGLPGEVNDKGFCIVTFLEIIQFQGVGSDQLSE